MLKLHGRLAERMPGARRTGLYSISLRPDLPEVLRGKKALLVHGANISPGFAHYFAIAGDVAAQAAVSRYGGSTLPSDFTYLGEEDVLSVSPDGVHVRCLWRAASPSNSILLTERCNNYCLMCSQPPKNVVDDWLLEEARELLSLVPRETKEIGFTGGEPTIYGEGLIDLLARAKSYLPNTAVHVLSNGRRFADPSFASAWADIQHPDLMVGIPLYSDEPSVHDFVVQASGAFDETVRGILQLKRLRQKVEIRVVIHQQTIARLLHLARFISRNLQFVDHVALMGLEMMGFTRANLDLLWIDPYEYKDILSESVATLAASGMTVSVYNHPLCVVNRDLDAYCRRSISDWKNEFLPECGHCSRKAECGGFFSSALAVRHTAYVKAFQTDTEAYVNP